MTPSEILPGTLDLLIRKTLTRGPLHGYGIAQYLPQVSGWAKARSIPLRNGWS